MSASMEREVRYCTTADGVRIGYKMWGNGPPLVFVFGFPGSIELEMELAVARAFYAGLATEHTVVRFDLRGTGASQRDVADLSIAARARDLSSLIEHLRLERFDLFAGPGQETHTALRFCASNPRQVNRLVLWEPTVVCSPRTGPVADAQRVLILDDWHSATSVFGRDFVRGWSDEDKRIMRRLYRETLTPDVFFLLSDTASDVSDVLGAVDTPTLILHARKDQQFAIDDARAVAAQMPDARLVPIEADHAYLYAFHDQIVPTVNEFLGGTTPDRESTAATTAFRTVLFTDLVGHTEMMQRLGDARGRDVLREHERITREILKQHGGREVKAMGDGFMASFVSVTGAMECAVALQRALAAHTESMPEPLHVRVGLNAGEPIEEDGDLFGSTVILASRIAAKAGAGEILIPEPVRHLLSGKPFVYADRGEFVPKGYDEAVRLYEVRWRET